MKPDGVNVDAGKLFVMSKTRMTMDYTSRDSKTKKATIELFYKGISLGISKGVVHESKTD